MNILTCSLWGKFQTEFLEKYNELAGEGPVIVILKHAAIREPQGNVMRVLQILKL
jgi:hypothetical protein